MPTAGTPPSPLPVHLYKILPPVDFRAVLPEGGPDGGATIDSSTIVPGTDLDRADGFIHLSTRAQVQGVLERFFTGPEHAAIALVRLDYAALDRHTRSSSRPGAKLQWDQAGAGVFAHVYGADLVGSVVRGYRFVDRGHGETKTWEQALREQAGAEWFVD